MNQEEVKSDSNIQNPYRKGNSSGEYLTRNPFKFLDSYTREDQEIFFGREQELDEIYRKFYKGRLLLVYGKSGTGKSSIINCGLVSKIPVEDILVIPVRCGKDPVNNLIADLRKFSSTDSRNPLEILTDIYEKNFKPVSLIFDQFEEIFILSKPDDRKQLILELLKILQSKVRANLVLIFREEYFAMFSEFEQDVPNLYANRVRIEKLNKTFVEEIIEKPCRSCNVQVETGLARRVSEILSLETGQIELTWFQILMDKLYKLAIERDRNNPALKISDLDKIGDIGNILGDFLNEQLLSMENAGEVEAILKTMISEDGTKKQITHEEIGHSLAKAGKQITGGNVKKILIDLVDRRIITEKDEHNNYEIKHDSLAIRIYERLTAEERKLKEIELLVKNAYRQYLQVDTLLNEQTLKFIEPYADSISLLPEQEKFLKHSKAQIQRSRKRKRNLVLAGGISLIVVLSFFTVWALRERNKAIEQSEITNKYTKFLKSANEDAEKNFKLALEKSVELGKARDTVIRAMEIVENELYKNIQNSLSVSSLNMNVLYRGVDNPVSVTASGIDQEKIFVYCYDPEDNSRKANITKQGDHFIVSNIHPSTHELVVKATGLTNSGDQLDLGTSIFRIKQLPEPYITIGEKKLTGGNIETELLAGIRQLDLHVNTDFKLATEISGFETQLIDEKGNKSVASSSSKYLTDEQRTLMAQAEPGSLLIINGISLNTINGIKQLDQSLYFRVGGDEIDKKLDNENKIYQLLYLAKNFADSLNYKKAYFYAKAAHKIDTTSLKANKALFSIYNDLSNTFLSSGELEFSYRLQRTKMREYIMIRGGYYGRETPKDGLYRFNGKNLEMVFRLKDFSAETIYYIESKGFFVMLLRKHNSYSSKVIIIDLKGNIIKEIPTTNNTWKIMTDKNLNYFISVNYSDNGGYYGRNRKAILYNLKDDKKVFLWRVNFDNVVTFIRADKSEREIVVPYYRQRRFEVWNVDGQLLKNIPVDGIIENIEFTPDNQILVALSTSGDKKDILLKKFNEKYEEVPVSFDDPNYNIKILTSDGKYVINVNSTDTKIIDFLGNEEYTIDYPIFNSSDWEEVTIQNDVVTAYSEKQFITIPLKNMESNIIDLIENKLYFGEMPKLSPEEQSEIDKIINEDK